MLNKITAKPDMTGWYSCKFKSALKCCFPPDIMAWIAWFFFIVKFLVLGWFCLVGEVCGQLVGIGSLNKWWLTPGSCDTAKTWNLFGNEPFTCWRTCHGNASALLALCEGNPLVTSGYWWIPLTKEPVMWSFNNSIVVGLSKKTQSGSSDFRHHDTYVSL